MDSHQPDHVNFSMPKKGGQVMRGKINAFVPFINIGRSWSGSLKVFSRNGKEILEMLVVHSLEDVRFLLEEKNDLIPCQLFSKVDVGLGFDVMRPLNSHGHLTTCFGKKVC
jgi:hypothetical protein